MSVTEKVYWYLFFESYCPICNTTYIEKERIYDRDKPLDYNERHIYKESYDFCS